MNWQTWEAVACRHTAYRDVLSKRIGDLPCRFRADAVRLEQILVNLLANAAKYTEPGGLISLSVERQGDDCIVRVQDTGIGISPELLPRVFDLFTQAAPAPDRSTGGLGIGLALVKRLVELHHGQVEAHSVVGQGSEFVLTLPAVVAPSTRPSPTTATATALD